MAATDPAAPAAQDDTPEEQSLFDRIKSRSQEDPELRDELEGKAAAERKTVDTYIEDHQDELLNRVKQSEAKPQEMHAQPMQYGKLGAAAPVPNPQLEVDSSLWDKVGATHQANMESFKQSQDISSPRDRALLGGQSSPVAAPETPASPTVELAGPPAPTPRPAPAGQAGGTSGSTSAAPPPPPPPPPPGAGGPPLGRRPKDYSAQGDINAVNTTLADRIGSYSKALHDRDETADRSFEAKNNELERLSKQFHDEAAAAKDAAGWADVAQTLGHAFAMYGAGKQGLKSGLDMTSGLKFDRVDFNKRYEQTLEELKMKLGELQSQRGVAERGRDVEKQVAEREFGVSERGATRAAEDEKQAAIRREGETAAAQRAYDERQTRAYEAEQNRKATENWRNASLGFKEKQEEGKGQRQQTGIQAKFDLAKMNQGLKQAGWDDKQAGELQGGIAAYQTAKASGDKKGMSVASDRIGRSVEGGADAFVAAAQAGDFSKLKPRSRAAGATIPAGQTGGAPAPYGDTVTQGDVTYKWNGTKYEAQP